MFDLGAHLKSMRDERGLTQRELADLLFAEFSAPSAGEELSPRQIKIMQKMFSVFTVKDKR